MSSLRRELVVIGSAVIAAAVLAVSTTALASVSTGCRAPGRHPFPSVSRLAASHTGCATARAVVEHIQGVWQTSNGTLPGWFKTSGHSAWWHCRYQPRGRQGHRYHDARCASGRALVTMRLNA
jgi:hypothetical protein